MLVVDSVTKRYGELSVFEKISFSVERGKIVGLLGLNGAGKSTLLKGLSTVQRFDGGSVQIDGVDLDQDPFRYRAMVGYQPEVESLHPAMTAKEQLRFFGALRGLTGTRLVLRVTELLTSLSLLHVQDAPSRELSQGERQRVSFAIASIHQPTLLILDEPTRGLDPEQLAFFRKTLREERSKRIVILSTHNLSEVHALCDVAIVLSDGNISVLDRELFEATSERLEKYFIRVVAA